MHSPGLDSVPMGILPAERRGLIQVIRTPGFEKRSAERSFTPQYLVIGTDYGLILEVINRSWNSKQGNRKGMPFVFQMSSTDRKQQTHRNSTGFQTETVWVFTPKDNPLS